MLISDGNSGMSDTADLTAAAARDLAATGAVTYAATFSADAYMPELELYTGECFISDTMYVKFAVVHCLLGSQ